jgi:creatinine amidohydrolase/Fe(II)-dependent formamide hydrolase-like protein
MSLSWLNTSPQIEASGSEIAILPLATFEPHGHVIQAASNQLILSEISAQVSKKLSRPTYLLPSWPFGTSSGSADKKGRITIEYSTLWAVVNDIVTSLLEHGFRQVVVINNTGSAVVHPPQPFGNEIVKTAVRQLNYENPGLTAIWVQPFRVSGKALQEIFASTDKERLDETVAVSILMAIGKMPVQVQMEGLMDSLHGISAEKGLQALEAVVADTVHYIERTFNQLGRIK